MKDMKKTKHIRFEWKHILIIFVTLIVFQVFVYYLQKNTLQDLLSDTMEWYKQNSAEEIGNLTTTSLELLLESDPFSQIEHSADKAKNLVHSFNSILKQPLMKRNVEEMCVILPHNGKFIAIDLGNELYSYFYNHHVADTVVKPVYNEAVQQYAGIHNSMVASELITSIKKEQSIFNVYVPLVPHGEYAGAVYLKIHPDFSFISNKILASFDHTVLIFSSLILMGLLVIFYISTYTILERDEARELLYNEREAHLTEYIEQKKEHLFTKRIYHTHHKAEKVMGFISDDLDEMKEDNFKEIKYRISKYANFISRVIYDMKWYNPPLQTIRNYIFRTDLNEVLKFIVENIFLRTSKQVNSIKFNLDLDQDMPKISINEFVIWEIVEPIIQNSIDHTDSEMTIIDISTSYDNEKNQSVLLIEDNGKGIREDLLEKNEFGIMRIFLENISTKQEGKSYGYGCYLAFEISKRCGWELSAENRDSGGARLVLRINH